MCAGHQPVAGDSERRSEMIKVEYDKETVLNAIDSVVKKTMAMDLTWDWPCGVAYYGICEAYEKTKKEEYIKLLQERVDERCV